MKLVPNLCRSTTTTDAKGDDHFYMNFYVRTSVSPALGSANNCQVEGPLNRGRVYLHMIRLKGHSDYEYKYLYVDVRGHQRIYLENADTNPKNPNKSKMKFLGINWG